MAWQPYEKSCSLGQTGTEGGLIVRDEEHTEGARITLEKGGGTPPCTITCGVYGWTYHTRFFGSREEADGEYERMKEGLGAITELLPFKSEPHYDERMLRTAEEVSRFVERFP